jgi:hypothetical protein
MVSVRRFATGAAKARRRQIRALLELGAALGLCEVIRPEQAYAGAVRAPNAYRLTYEPSKGKKAPTDEWRSVTAIQAEMLVARFRAADAKTRATAENRPAAVRGVE